MSSLDDEIERSVRGRSNFTAPKNFSAARIYLHAPPEEGDISQLRSGDEVALYDPGIDAFDVVIEERYGDSFVGRIAGGGDLVAFRAYNIVNIFKCGGRDLLEDGE
jgi:hypothetical protein